MKQLKVLLLIFLVAVTANNCKEKEPDSPPQETIILTQNEQEVVPMQLATLKGNKTSYASAEYAGSLGGEPIKVAVSGNLFSFITPSNLGQGPAILALTVDGQQITLNYTIKASVNISDPNSVITAAIDRITLTNGELDNIGAELGTNGSPDRADNIAMLKDLSFEMENKLSNMNAQERAELAKFIQANPLLFEEESSPLLLKDSFQLGKTSATHPEATMNELFQRMDRDKKILYLLAATSAVTLYFGMPYLSAFTAGAALYKIYLINDKNIMTLGKALVQFKELLLADMSMGKKSDFTFYKDKKYNFSMKSEYRALNAMDAGSSSSSIMSISTYLNDISEGWNNAKKIAGLVSKVLKGDAYHFKNVSATKSGIYRIHPQYLMLTNLSNGVTVNQTVFPDHHELTFSTTSTTDLIFSFEVVYTHELVGEKRITYTGKIIVNSPITVSTGNATNVTSNSAKVPVTIENMSSLSISEKGVVFSKTTQLPTTADSKVIAGSGSANFEAQLNNLSPFTSYYVRGYVVGPDGPVYGDVKSIWTLSEPDSTLFYKYECVGQWSVTNLESNVTYTLVTKADGTGIYTQSGNPTQYGMTWEIRKYTIAGKAYYRMYEKGFWHPGYNELNRDNLSNPVTSFTLYGGTNGTTPSITYTKN